MPRLLTAKDNDHPFVKAWVKKNNELGKALTEILAYTGWSVPTFYNKIQQGKEDKLVLTELEAHFISQILPISKEEIFNHQNNQ